MGQPYWRYWFDHVAEAGHDTCPHDVWHDNEALYVFDNLRLTDPMCQYANETDLAFAAQVTDYWAQLARVASSDQALASVVRWPAYLYRWDCLLRIGLHKRAGLKAENRFTRARLALFRRAMRYHVTLEQMRRGAAE